jgi:hypothetical protein
MAYDVALIFTDERTLLFVTGDRSMAKPTDFFVGVSDMFAIFLPGACITYISLKLSERSGIHPAEFLRFRTKNEGYVGFVAIAYLVGHMLDMVGAVFLDRWYDFTYAHRKRSPSLSLWRWLLQTPARMGSLLRPKPSGTGAAGTDVRTDLQDPLLAEAQRLAAGSITPGDPVYQWCKAWICLKSPTAFNEVERMQANSKFFRGLVSVFFLSALASVLVKPPFPNKFEWFAACLFLALVSFLRFCDLRWKSVHQTYRFYVAMRSDVTLISPPSPMKAEDNSG